jgi:hypothetical protein
MNESDRFAQADQQVSTLKDRIARQREAVKQAKQAKLRGHSVALAEAAQQALEQPFAHSRSIASKSLRG